MHSLLLVTILFSCTRGFTFAKPESGPDKFQRVISAFVQYLETNATWRAEFEQFVAEDKAAVSSDTIKYIFNCEINDTEATPRSVHELRPQDINVIASLGDSITAGNGVDAWSPIGVIQEKRGESWCIGGDKSLEGGVHTITNVLKKFNKGIKGYSIKHGDEGEENAWLNYAIPGAIAEDIPGEADWLIWKMKNDSRIDFENDWKLITLLIGGNDLCGYCTDKVRYSKKKFKKNLQEALDKLHAAVPRALVNLVAMADVTPITTIRTGIICSVLHWALCNCARKNETRYDIKAIQVMYHDAMSELASSGRYDNRDDFTVVLQPHLLSQEFPRDPINIKKYDKSFIAPDCFHPNRKAHQGLSFFYWNTMLTPVGQKPTSHEWSPSMNTTYKCPTKLSVPVSTQGDNPTETYIQEHPYIFTSRNSPVVATTPRPTPSSASSQFASSLFSLILSKRVFWYGTLLAVLLF